MPTLADLQAERERLRAANAKVDFESAHAASIGRTAVLAAGNAVRGELLAALDALPARMVSAIAGETDETRVHYLLSDLVHDWLT